MDRREFPGTAVLAAAAPAGDVFVERPAPGKPHRGLDGGEHLGFADGLEAQKRTREV